MGYPHLTLNKGDLPIICIATTTILTKKYVLKNKTLIF